MPHRLHATPRFTTLSLSLLMAVSLGCGDDAPAGDPDAGGPASFSACERDDLVIAAFDISTMELTLFNPTASDITVDSSSPYQVCPGIGRYAQLPAVTPVVVPSLGTATFDLSETSLTFDPVNDNIALYSDSAYTTRDSMLDFICWGAPANRTLTRVNVAREQGTDGSVLWAPTTCIDLAGATRLVRNPEEDGSELDHYSTTGDVSITCP